MLTNYTIEGFENIQYQGYEALFYIQSKLRNLYKLYGYHQISTPTFEMYDLYAAEESIVSDDLFKLVNHQGKVLTLKPDATLPITRMAAINHKDPREIIKFSYLTNLYRNFSSPEIIKKEETQMGVEYFGNNNPECDGEVIEIAINSLLKCGITDVHIDLGHVGFINHLLNSLNFCDRLKGELFQLIENKNIGDIAEFLEKNLVDKKIGHIILRLPKLYGEPKEIFEEMLSMCINSEMEEVVQTLKSVYRHLEEIGLGKYISFDIGFTNAMNYYSDIIFKGYIDNWGEPVLNGGRYNHLSEKFGIKRPAVGFSVDILKMMDYMDKNALLPEDNRSKTAILYDCDSKVHAYKLADNLRTKGESTELFILKVDPIAFINSQSHNELYKHTRFFLMEKNHLKVYNGKDFIEIKEEML